MRRLALVAALFCLAAFSFNQRANAQVALNETPAVISAAVGWFDLVQDDDQAVDFRLEYRHGEDFFFLKPWGGVEVTTDGSVWAGIGVLMDVIFFEDFIVTGSIAPGFYEEGDGKDLGSAFEIRSQIELGYQFENLSRVSLGFSHISNASVEDDNPGTEILSLYYHLPLDAIF
ncbi:acyloxyacyl hydrolase [Pelagibius sp.]|uniref:acyloxyacyl hydrolase n=1 Tax=Pelagibius sp. TaxID=1931238 RepID=UPI003B50C9B8